MTLPFGVITIADLPLLLPVIVLASWLFAAIGLVFTSFITVIDLYSFYYTLFLTPMWLFSGIFFPLATLPTWVTSVAWVTPLYHVVNLGKAAVHGGWALSHLVDGVWSVIAALALTALAIRRLRRRLVR